MEVYGKVCSLVPPMAWEAWVCLKRGAGLGVSLQACKPVFVQWLAFHRDLGMDKAFCLCVVFCICAAVCTAVWWRGGLCLHGDGSLYGRL